MPEGGPGEVTRLLRQWRQGDREALDDLMPFVYDELRRLAGAYMRSERREHTLEATALVHEAFLRLVESDVSWNDRAHFMSVAALAMRRILVDHARARGAAKRAAGERAGLDMAMQVPARPSSDLLALDEALRRLEAIDTRKCRVVEMIYFGGLSHEQAAEVLQVSVSTVQRDLRQARAWLYREIA